jgi:hypothetical protein
MRSIQNELASILCAAGAVLALACGGSSSGPGSTTFGGAFTGSSNLGSATPTVVSGTFSLGFASTAVGLAAAPLSVGAGSPYAATVGVAGSLTTGGTTVALSGDYDDTTKSFGVIGGAGTYELKGTVAGTSIQGDVTLPGGVTGKLAGGTGVAVKSYCGYWWYPSNVTPANARGSGPLTLVRVGSDPFRGQIYFGQWNALTGSTVAADGTFTFPVPIIGAAPVTASGQVSTDGSSATGTWSAAQIIYAWSATVAQCSQ